MASEAVAEFRQRIFEDEDFRGQFAKAPNEALKSVGITVPEGVEFPPMDPAELDSQIAELKRDAGDDVSKLWDPAMVAAEGESGEVSDAALENVAGGLSSFQSAVQKNQFLTFTRALPRFERAPTPIKDLGGPVYTISAYGTLDW